MLKYIILGFLSYQPMTGYDIERWMSVSTGHFWHAKLSQIYTTLKKLEEEALVTSHIEPQAGRPDRCIYTLTDAGQQALQAWQQELMIEPEVKKDALLVKLFFAAPADKEKLLTQLKLQLDLHRRQQERYEQSSPQAIQDFVVEHPELTANTPLWELTRRYGLMYEATYIEWLQLAIQVIEQDLS